MFQSIGDRPSGPPPPEGQAGGLTSGRPGSRSPAGPLDPPGLPVDGAVLPVDQEPLGPPADHEAVARKILLDQLTGTARSRSELSVKLARKGVPVEVADRLLDRFEEVGLVDDEAFARAWIQSRQPGKGLARRALAQELRRKGVDDEVARAALDEVDPEDELDAARVLVQRKLRTVGRLERDTAVRRLTGMLARKGYPAGVCFRVVREELDAWGHDTEDLGEPDSL